MMSDIPALCKFSFTNMELNPATGRLGQPTAEKRKLYEFQLIATMSVVRTFEEEQKFIKQLDDVTFRIEKGFVKNMKVH